MHSVGLVNAMRLLTLIRLDRMISDCFRFPFIPVPVIVNLNSYQEISIALGLCVFGT